MSSFKTIWDCMFSPKLIKIYGNGPVERLYQPASFEKWGDQVIHSLYVIWKIGVYTSPLLVGILYSRGYFAHDGLVTLTKLVTSIGVILVVSFCCRGVSRAQNPTYQKFLETWQKSQVHLTPTVKQQLSMYDFDFRAWPVEYTCEYSELARKVVNIPCPAVQSNVFEYVTYVPYKVIAYIAIHTFGIRLIYPGSIGLLQAVLDQSLLQGRSRLVEILRGERFKIKTCDNNEIDSMFVDRRNTTPSGNTLVICCEGNAGFYEIGITGTPIEAGYSVLGWNHPGFGGSSGQPYPKQEHNAIDAVVQFAIHKLGFRVEDILFFGWSIGGYTTTWAAMNYPDAKGVILDAVFDDVLPLAINQMPSWWEPIVKLAIREYVNLNIYGQLAKYPGPIAIIRRTEDEVICLKENDLSSNRGNHLLIKLLRYRYPCIFDDTQMHLLNEFLSVSTTGQEEHMKNYSVDENMCQSLLQSYISEYTKSYPMKIGEEFNIAEKNQMTLYLAHKYMKDFKSSHCTPLPPEMFQLPWDINVEADFVFT